MSKCSLHVLTFEFKTDGWPTPMDGNKGKILIIKDAETGQEVPIKTLSINQAYKR